MSSLPRPAQAAVIDIATRQPQPMAVEPQPTRNTGRRLRWHKAQNRMNDPQYLALGPLAQAALRNLEELEQASGGPLIGNRSRICQMLCIEPKNARHVIEPLVAGGFISVEESGGQMVVRLLSDPPQTPVRPPADPPQTPVRRNKKSASDAGLPPRSLNREIETVPIGTENQREKEKGTGNDSADASPPEVSPLPPAPDDCADDPAPTAPTVTAADLIAAALAAKQVTPRGADAHAFYRAEAIGFMTRRPPGMRNEVWASWVVQAIAACPPERYPVAVNACLKASKLAGAFIPPEPDSRPRSDRKETIRRGADRKADPVAAESGTPRPFSVRDIKL